MTKKNENNFVFRMELPGFVRLILKRLRKSNFKAYVVGGAIRDTILGRNVIDWDITTSATVPEIKSVFSNIRYYTLKHETVTLVQSKRLFEITVMKGKGNSDADINIDLSQRDFTVNAMAYDDLSGTVLDPYNGMGDIKRKRVRAVLNPCDRFKEDPLRILRAVRIAAELGFVIEKGTMESVGPMAGALRSISVERIREEFTRIIIAEQPSGWLNILRKTGVLNEIIPELMEGYRKRQNKWHRYTILRHTMITVDSVPPSKVLRLAALLHDIGKPGVRKKVEKEFHFYNHAKVGALIAKNIMERLRFSNEEIGKVTNLIACHMIEYNKNWGDGAVRRFVRRIGKENIDDLFSLRRADILAHGIPDKKLDLLNDLEERVRALAGESAPMDISDLAVDGKRVMGELGLKPGPGVGRILKNLLEKVTDDPGLNTEEKLISLIHETEKQHV